MLQGFARVLSQRHPANASSHSPTFSAQSPPKKLKSSCNCHIDIAKLRNSVSALQKQLLETQATLRSVVKEGIKKFDEGAQLVFEHWQQSLSKEVGVELRLAGLTDAQLALVRQSTTMYYDSSTDSPRWKRRKIEEWKGNEFFSNLRLN